MKVISIGMFTAGNAAVVWRGPMLHRALQQFLADVYWGDLDVLLLDLPPGTGDVAISLAQLLPNAEILVVTTPQTAAAEVAERAGRDRDADPPAPRRRGREHVLAGAARRGERMEVFGAGGGQTVADSLTRRSARRCRCWVRSRWTRLREAGDAGTPIVLADPDAPASSDPRHRRQDQRPVEEPARAAAGAEPRQPLTCSGRSHDLFTERVTA